ncbi:MAG: MupA/Atu3671 family FMN-dependent luciferase-like monooxygenase [Actinomycetota bacterium]
MTYSTLVFVGDHPLLVACAGRAREAGLIVDAVSTDDPSIAAWASGEGIDRVAWSDLTEHVTATRPDVLVSVGNLRILPDDMVDATKVTVNFHDGPLPTYAGLHTPMWALLDDATEYEVTWHVVEGGIDEGDVLATSGFQIAADETTRSMNLKCFAAAGEAFEEVLEQLTAGELRRTAQSGEGRYCGRYDRPVPAGALVPHTMAAAEIERLVRALDFGPTINRVGRALLQIDDHHVVVVHGAGPSDIGRTATPGTVLATSARDGDVTLTVATTTDPIELRCWAEPGATIQGLTDAVLPDPTPLLGEIEQRHQASVRSEVWWSKRVAAAVDPDLSHFGEGSGASEALAPLRCESPEEAMAVAAAFVLSYCGQESATLGVDVAPGAPPAMQAWFTTVVPVDVTADYTASGADVVAGIRDSMDIARERGPFLRDVPIRMPVQVDGPITTAPPAVSIVDGDTTTESVLEIAVVDGGAACRVVARTESHGLAGRIAAGLDMFAAAYRAGSVTRLVDLPVLGNDETEALLGKGGTPADAPFAGPLHEQFIATATERPDDVAVVHRGRDITYRDLEERARRVATALERHGVQPGGFVGVSTAPGLDMVVGILGVLMAGAAYVPLDPRFPADRLSFMVGDAAMDLVLTDDLSSVPEGAPAALDIGATSVDRTVPPREVLPAVAERDLAYMMYTSGSTGLPKGVMVQHDNVDSFLRAMESHVGTDPGVWLSVTTLSFDISVLELFYPLTRGWKVVLYEGLAASRPSGPVASHSTESRLDVSLFFFGSEAGEGATAYEVLLDSARFADEHGFAAVWTPERHFNAFGGPFPNPSVTGAAIAAVTERVGIRSGSCVLPLHHPVRAAEEWAVVDNLSGGRVGLSIAAGWHPEDFILRPQNFQQPKTALLEQIDELRRMWRGEAVTYEGPKGPVDVLPLPRPVQEELPIWYTTAGNVESFKLAGANGFHLLTHQLGQSLDELAEKVAAYRRAWTEAGHAGRGTVSLMLHTFVTADASIVRETVREPMKGYLRDSIALVKEHASAFPTFDPTKTEADGALAGLTPEDLDALLEVSFARYFETSGLFGDVEQAIEFAEGIAGIDVDEIAALIDFGVEGDTILANLPHLDRVRAAFAGESETVEFETYGSLMDEYEVTHLQCTPSEARIILADPQSKAALGRLTKMLVGGEACPLSVAAELHEAVGGQLINVYGPTETTIWSTAHTITDEDLEAGAIPIGRPLANTSVRIVAPSGQLRPAGAIGELLIGGTGVTAGYHERAELTADRFVERMDTPGRVYRTGDLVSWRPDGRLAFHGRADSQVKVRGHRIELGEIEAALESRDDIGEAVVVVHGEAEAAALVAHLVAAEGARPDADTAIQQALGASLPSHMVPERLQWHAVLPTTPNGKVDRKTLSQLDPTATPSAPVAAPAEAEATSAAPTPPVSADAAAAPGATMSVADMAALVEDAWKAVLGVPAIDRNTSFFDHGGNSLQVVTLRDGLEERLGRPVSLVDVFRYGTVNELAGAFADDAAPGPTADPGPGSPDPVPVPVGAGNGATPRPVAASSNARANRRAAARQRARRGR